MESHMDKAKLQLRRVSRQKQNAQQSYNAREPADKSKMHCHPSAKDQTNRPLTNSNCWLSKWRATRTKQSYNWGESADKSKMPSKATMQESQRIKALPLNGKRPKSPSKPQESRDNRLIFHCSQAYPRFIYVRLTKSQSWIGNWIMSGRICQLIE